MKRSRKIIDRINKLNGVDEYADIGDYINKGPGANKSKKGGSKRKKLFGYNATAILRWMGKDEWTMEDAKKACKALGLDVADGTITAQLAAGRKGTRGEPAPLTKKQISELYDAVDGDLKPINR